MKHKKMQKLSLNKMTVAHLMDEKMNHVLGGNQKERCAYSVVIQSCHMTEFTCIENCPFTYVVNCITEIIECI